MLNVLDLFSGIGGFSLGFEKTNEFKTVAFIEIDPFCRKVLNKNWPNVPIFEDIKTITEDDLQCLDKIDVICGGFPCQPVSSCGKRQGDCDERWLWPEFYRVVCMVKPSWIVVENVVGLLSIDNGQLFGGILRDLAQIGYNAEWQVLRASDVGAPHKRERIFLVAYSDSIRLDSPPIFKRSIYKNLFEKNFWPNHNTIYIGDLKRTFPEIPINLRNDDGISEKLDKDMMRSTNFSMPNNIIQHRIKALGNAIVLQLTEYIGVCILNCYNVNNQKL